MKEKMKKAKQRKIILRNNSFKEDMMKNWNMKIDLQQTIEQNNDKNGDKQLEEIQWR